MRLLLGKNVVSLPVTTLEPVSAPRTIAAVINPYKNGKNNSNTRY